MQYGIGTSVNGRAKLDVALPQIAGAGFTQVEMSCEPNQFEPGKVDVAGVVRMMQDCELSARAGHTIFSTVNCGSLDETQRRTAVQTIAACFEILVEIGVEIAVVHANASAADHKESDWQVSRGKSRQSIEELTRHAERTGIRMAVENLPNHNTPRPYHSMTELRQLINDLPDHVGLCLDTTHAVICGHDPVEQLDIAGDRLFTLHLHDTDGTEDCHWVPGRGVIDWPAFIGRLNELNFTGTRILEVVAEPDAVEQTIGQARDVAIAWENDP